jgi:cysteine dioxygenase
MTEKTQEKSCGAIETTSTVCKSPKGDITVVWGPPQKKLSTICNESKDSSESKEKGLRLQELAIRVCEELNKGKDRDLMKVKEAMTLYDASRNEWKRYAFFDPDKKYTRNLIATDNTTFTLMLLCWNPLKSSPVHDHAGSECFMRTVSGQVRESQYEWVEKGCECESKQLKLLKATELVPGSVAYINDSIGMHKVENATDKQAVTLHCYIPPYQSCRCFLDDTAKACTATMTFHSVEGKLKQCE